MLSSPAADSQSLAIAAWALRHLQLVGSCPRVLQVMIQAALHQLRQQQLGGTGGASAKGSVLSSRAVASLVWAAGQVAGGAADRGSHKQQPGHSRQQQYIKQQRRLQLMLHSLHSASAVGPVLATGSVAAAPVVMSPHNHWSATDQALQADVQQLLLAAAGVQQQQQQAEQHQQYAFQEQHLQQRQVVVADASLQDLSQILVAVGRMRIQLPVAWWQQCFQQLIQLLMQQQTSLLIGKSRSRTIRVIRRHCW